MNDAHTVVENAMKTHNSALEWSEGELNTLLKLKRKKTISKIQEIQMKHDEITSQMKELLGKYEHACKGRENLLQQNKILLQEKKHQAIRIDELKKTNNELGKELSLLKSSNVNGTTSLMIHGTEYIITITNEVYKVEGNDAGALAGTFRECEDYRRATMIHNGWKGFIEWERDHPIKTCEINPSMNGLSH